MSLPNFEQYKRPALEVVSDGHERHWTVVATAVADLMGLTPEQREEMIGSGSRTVLADRVQWALTDLRQARLLESAGRGINRITKRGREYLYRAPAVIDRPDLMEFEEFRQFMERTGTRARRSKADGDPTANGRGTQPAPQTPLEQIDTASAELREELAAKVLESVRSATPVFFERLVVDLMLKLGYGGPQLAAGEVLGRSGDGGIDGVINEDVLGLDKIYLQAKRWSADVGAPALRDFVGSLIGKNADKGVFITTSGFNHGAKEYLRSVNRHIALITGKELAELMIDYGLGVTVERTYEIKRLDTDFFEDV